MSGPHAKRASFTRQDRICRNADFQEAFEKGRRFQGRLLTIYVLKNELGRNRLGLAVGKKAGNSVRRNRIRRVIREAFRLNRHLLAPRFDLVILAGRNWGNSCLSDVQAEITRLFQKVSSSLAT